MLLKRYNLSYEFEFGYYCSEFKKYLLKDFGVQDYKIYKAGYFGKWFVVADLTTHAFAYTDNI